MSNFISTIVLQFFDLAESVLFKVLPWYYLLTCKFPPQNLSMPHPPIYMIDLAFRDNFIEMLLLICERFLPQLFPSNVSCYNFLWIKILPNPATFVLQEILVEEFFAKQSRLPYRSSMQSLTQDKNIN